MSVTCTNYDAWIARWHEETYRLCLALVLNTKTAEEMTFQAYLRLGAGPPDMDEASARMALYAAAIRVCRAYYLKKLRRKPRKKALEAQLGDGAPPALVAFLRMPFQCKAAAFLLHIAAFTPEDAGKILGMQPARAAQLGAVPDMESIAAALYALRRGENAKNGLSDRLYLRFSERNVAFETRMLDLGQRFARVAPLLALAVLALFVWAVVYTANL